LERQAIEGNVIRRRAGSLLSNKRILGQAGNKKAGIGREKDITYDYLSNGKSSQYVVSILYSLLQGLYITLLCQVMARDISSKFGKYRVHSLQ